MGRQVSEAFAGSDPRYGRALTAVLSWFGAWLVVRSFGAVSPAAAAAFAIPVALTAGTFGWVAGGLTALASAVFAGPFSPALEAAPTQIDTLVHALLFLGVAAAASRTAGAGSVDEDAPSRATAESDPQSMATISRELHTPVQAIQGAVTLLDRLLPGDGEERVAVATLRRATSKLDDLQQLLGALGQELSTERRASEQTLVDLRRIAGDVGVELRAHGGLDRLRFDAASDADVLMGHEERLHLLLRCLIGDALEHSRPDHPVDCTVRRDVDSVVLRVTATTEAEASRADRIRQHAGRELALRLGGTFDAVQAGGGMQTTVRLPQRRDTDPLAPRERVPADASSLAFTVGATSVWSRVIG